MRKQSLLTLLAAVVIAGTGCLKDKGFEDQEYGTQIQEVKGVAFPQSSSSPVTVAITGQAAPLEVDGPDLTLEQSGVASTDVHVTLEVNQTLVDDLGITRLPAGNFAINSLTVTVAAGQKFSDALKISVLNSNTLDPQYSYGVGLTIKSVDQGYTIAANQKNIVVSFSIKNKYDGVYNLKGVHNRVPFNYPYETVMHMITTGPSSVAFYWPDAGSAGHPIGVGPNNSLSWYGPAVSPVVVFNQANDLVTNVYNVGAGGPPIDIYTGAGSGQGRFVDNAVPTNKKMYVYFRYNANDLRGFLDTLTFISPRP